MSLKTNNNNSTSSIRRRPLRRSTRIEHKRYCQNLKSIAGQCFDLVECKNQLIAGDYFKYFKDGKFIGAKVIEINQNQVEVGIIVNNKIMPDVVDLKKIKCDYFSDNDQEIFKQKYHASLLNEVEDDDDEGEDDDVSVNQEALNDEDEKDQDETEDETEDENDDMDSAYSHSNTSKRTKKKHQNWQDDGNDDVDQLNLNYYEDLNDDYMDLDLDFQEKESKKLKKSEKSKGRKGSKGFKSYTSNKLGKLNDTSMSANNASSFKIHNEYKQSTKYQQYRAARPTPFTTKELNQLQDNRILAFKKQKMNNII